MKRRKITLEEVANIGGGYYKFARAIRNGVSGYLYWMSRELKSDEKDIVLLYKNTELLCSHPQYAPELKSRVIFCGDKCFR